MPEPLQCDLTRLQDLEAKLEVERRYALSAREAQVRAEEAQAVAEERLLQVEAALEAALQESSSTARYTQSLQTTGASQILD